MLHKLETFRQPTVRLIGGIWITVLIFVFFVANASLNARQEALTRARFDALAEANLVAEHAANIIDLADVTLLTVKDILTDEDLNRNIGLPAKRLAFLNSSLKDLQHRARGILSLSITDTHGIVFSNSLDVAPGVSLASRDYFIAIKKQPQSDPVISQAVLGRVSKRWGIQVARRLEFKDGRFAGMLVANVGLPESFDTFYEQLTAGKRDVVALYDEDSRLISRFPRADQLLGKSLPPNGVSDALKNRMLEGVIEQKSVVDGEVRLFAFRRSPRYNLYALVAPVKTDVLAVWIKAVTLNVVYCLLAIVAGLYFTYLIRKSDKSIDEIESVRNHLEAIANGGASLIWTSGLDKVCDYLNEPWLKFFGLDLAEGLKLGWIHGIHPDDQAYCLNTYAARFEQQTSFEMQYRRQHASGEYRWILDQGNPRFGANGDFIGYIGFCYDITERFKADAQIRQAASVFDNANEGIEIVDLNGILLDVNSAFSQITGYTREEVLGRNVKILQSDRHAPEFYADFWRELNDKGQWSGELWNKRKSGDDFVIHLTVTSTRDANGLIDRYIGMFHDITPLKEHQVQLEHLAHHDALTQLPNRVLLTDRLSQAMLQAERRKNLLALVYIDLDGFKSINDSFGHAAGDQLLIAMSGRMKTILREGDSLARIGGDEFVAVLLDLKERDESIPIVQRLLEVLSAPVQLDGMTLKVTASMGLTFFPQLESIDSDQLLRQADHAMYQSKHQGKNCFTLFDADNDRSLRGKHESIERIRSALQNDELTLYYQPKINLKTGEFVGLEALLRWQHPDQGLLGPLTFLPLIEDHDLIALIGDWVIDNVLTQMDGWQAEGHEIRVSVNVAGRQLQAPEEFLSKLSEALHAHPMVAHQLEFEVLETGALSDIEDVSKLILSCATMGILFALDDFGTGFSSLSYLKRLPASIIKIDQSFVSDMLEDPDDLAILDGVIGLAESFNRKVLAEGIETWEQAAALVRMGCDFGQGYAIARPMPGASVTEWLSHWRANVRFFNPPRMNRGRAPLLIAYAEHRAWFRDLKALRDGGLVEGAVLENRCGCKFGNWMSEQGRFIFPQSSLVENIAQMHDRVHHCEAALLAGSSEVEAQSTIADWDELEKLHSDLSVLVWELLDAPDA